MDTLAVVKSLELLEAREESRHPATPSTTAPPATRSRRQSATGTLHIDAEKLIPLAQDMFRGLLRIGFRNIHVVVHHQTENFAAGMPTDLAFKFAARQAIFAFLEKQRGEGWWGSEKMAEYYAEQSSGDDPFNWIKMHPLMTPQTMGDYPYDHAGEGETSFG